jgi:hypothetical protein
MKAKVGVKADGISDYLNGMLNRTQTIQTFLRRVIYPQYTRAQERRWMTENMSEGSRWTALAPGYARSKRTRYASYPGAGEKLMVATGALSFAAVGRGRGAYRMITNEKFVVGIDDTEIPYAKWAAEDRPIMEFSEDRVEDWNRQIARYIKRGNP